MQPKSASAPVSRFSVERLLKPRSIAIVGASPTPGALGASVLANLERNGFDGQIHLINPKRDEIGGRPCLKSVDGLPEGVDTAVLAIPRAAVVDSIKALARRGVGSAVIFTAGFAEGGAEGLAEQEEIARVATEAGMVVIGPNCLGATNFLDRIPLTFVETTLEKGQAGGISIVSQSGAMAAVLGTTLASRKLGLSFSVSTGNEAVTGVEDYLEYVVQDPSTRVVVMFVEQFRQPRRFLAAAHKARADGKTIVLVHPGKSAAARASAATHTGALAGDYKVMRSLVERAGVAIVETLEELADAAEIALRCPALPRGGAVVLGESGAFKALCLDLCEDLELALTPLDDVGAPALRAALPVFVPVSNPLDLTAQGLVDPDLYRRTLLALLSDDRVGAVLVGIIQTDPVTVGIKAPSILQALRETAAVKPVIFAGLDEGAILQEGLVEDLRALGVPYFPSSERALRAIRRLTALEAATEATTPALAALPGLDGDEPVIPEAATKAILGPAGVPFPAGRMAATLDEAKAAAEALGYPVALKIQSAALSHKSDVGGVILNCGDAEAVAGAWRTMMTSIGRIQPPPQVDGVLVERMGRRGLELIVGGRNDPDWGPVVLVGFGGVQAEILQDVRLFGPNLSREAIVGELHKLKQAQLLSGFRGSPAMDVDAVADIVRVVAGVLQSSPKVREIDLNPVVVYPAGEGAVALDALIYMSQ